MQAQSWMPVINGERGDTISYSFPPHDSTFIRNQLIIKFRPTALRLDKLCYPYDWYNIDKDESPKTLIGSLPDNIESQIRGEHFPIDSLVVDTNLAKFIKSFGGSYLKRITIANPCTDTISIARNGDTLQCSDYLWMTLHINNDTSVVNACLLLTILYQHSLEVAEPNYILEANRIPNDGLHGLQLSQFPKLMNVQRAWNFQTGNYGIKCAVIDNGIDYRHCDFGGNFGLGYKVVGGWSWTENNRNFHLASSHGTPVAGIIGALTNRNCATSNQSVAGIAGGWGPSNGGADEGLGIQLFGFKTNVPWDENSIRTDYAIAAIREASAFNPATGYGYGVHILNNSWGSQIYNEAMRSAINYSFEHNVSIVVSRGNDYNRSPLYPACYENSWITSVGAGDENKQKRDYSSYGLGMDFIAPAAGVPAVDLVYTTKYGGDYKFFNGTSAAAPQVSGLIGLLRSEALENGWVELEPEDYEGMIKASCEGGESEPYNIPNLDYSEERGWGHVQADRIFNMLNEGYRVSHFMSQNVTSFGSWSNRTNMEFLNEGRLQKFLPSGTYSASRREVNFATNLQQGRWLNNNENRIYYWGRSGQGAQGGYSAANPNYQTKWSEITNGVGGNDNVIGIRCDIDNNELQIQGRTFQYDVYTADGRHIGLVPPTEDLQFNFSVFGRENSLSVRMDSSDNLPIKITLIPNPSHDELTIGYTVTTFAPVVIRLIDNIGRIVTEINEGELSKGSYMLTIPVSGIAQGTYRCVVQSGNQQNAQLVQIIR